MSDYHPTPAREEIIGDCRLILGDCREILPTLAPLSVYRGWSVVSDPPYGMKWNTDSTRFSAGQRFGRGEGRSDWGDISGDNEAFDTEPWRHFDECILWGANHYHDKVPAGTTLVWLKRYVHQYGTFLSDAEVGWMKGGCGVYCYHAPDSIGRRQKEFTGDPFGGETAHPTQKPIALMHWCIERLEGQTIIDPYMGSGTTGIAAAMLRRKFIGIEIYPKYFDIACRRIEAAYKQPDLFIPSPSPNPVQLNLLEAAE